MKIEVDVSSKLEQSGRTVFAFSNDKKKAVILPQVVRDEILKILSGDKLKNRLKLFAICVFLLIKDDLSQLDKIIIDLREYTGHQEIIKNHLLNFIRTYYQKTFEPEKIEISIKGISKKTKAHQVALKVYREKDKDNEISVIKITSEKILEILIKK
jgi:hypothetical protein